MRSARYWRRRLTGRLVRWPLRWKRPDDAVLSYVRFAHNVWIFWNNDPYDGQSVYWVEKGFGVSCPKMVECDDLLELRCWLIANDWL